MNRRTCLQAAALLAASTSLASDAADKKLRVGVIGHTGRGNYGHGIDTAWLSVPEAEIVAVADADAAGLDAAKKRLKIDAGFADYREMLTKTSPDIGAIAPRHVDQHRDMIVAAAQAGAKGIYMEKPFCRTPAEADEIIAACEKGNVKLALAHRNRYHPALAAIDRLIADGGLGRILEIRSRGKEDKRGGGEDLWVLGSHVLNLVHYFGGAPKTCSAVLMQNGKRVTKADVRPGAEGLGSLAGNEVHARYEMERGFVAYFDSIADSPSDGFGLRIQGTKGIVDLRVDKLPVAHFRKGHPFAFAAEANPWVVLGTAGPDQPEPRTDLAEFVANHRGPVYDLLAAIQENRRPLCDMHAGATTVEMICAAFESHRQNSAAVTFPLQQRGNALDRL